MPNPPAFLKPFMGRKSRIMMARYGAVLLALALMMVLLARATVTPLLLALLVVGAILLLAADHFRLAAENDRLADEGAALDRKAHSDPLTGLMNRVAFRNVLDEGQRTGNFGEIAILFLDLNRFKHINDTLGHRVGDLLLAEVAKALNANLDHAFAVARMGGDEFAAILPVAGEKTPESRAMAIAQTLRGPFLLEGHLVQSGASVGIAFGDLAHTEGGELLKRADLAMYEAKKAHINGFRIFDDTMEETLSAKVNIRTELTDAMKNGELVLHFQPIINARTGELKSVEALLRWYSPRLGDISPGTLIPIAEESGQIIELSNWVIDQALVAAKTLEDVPVGINISPLHFRHTGFATMLADKMLEARVPPELLYLEITEGVLISHVETAKRTIAQLRELGIKVFLDDFGTGYSSLSYLQNLDFDGMKIDKSFLQNIGERPQATQIIRSVIDLGHGLNMQVIAEGVESDWQARLLQLLNCDMLQGFHFATAMPLQAVKPFQNAQSRANEAKPEENILPDSRAWSRG